MIRANIIFFCCFVTFSSSSFADPVGKENKIEIIMQILSLSGLDYQIEQLPNVIRNNMNQQPMPPMGRDRIEVFEKAFLSAFEPLLVRDTITKYFERHYDERRYSELLVLLKKPIAIRMTELEKQASTPESHQEMLMTGNVLMGKASPDRFELIHRLDDAIQSSESMLASQVMITKIMIEGIDPLMPEEKRLRPGQMDILIGQTRDQLIYPIRQFTTLSLLYTFRSVSDDELRNYLALYESETGKWSTKLVNNAFMEIFERAIQRVTETLKRELMKDHAA